MRIGLLGGTFNPIHWGHLQIAERVLNRLKLNRVLFIPTGKAPHKKETGMASRRDRWRMVCRALQGIPSFKPCDIEINRKGVSYTVDTVTALKRRYPQDTFFFIIGTDTFSDLAAWKAPEQLLGLCHFVVVPRIGHLFSLLPKLAACDRMDRTVLKQLDEKKRRRYTFSTPHGTRIYFLRIAMRPIAASEIRTLLKEMEPLKTKFLAVPKNMDRLLPISVGSYIMARKLYRKESHSEKGRKGR